MKLLLKNFSVLSKSLSNMMKRKVLRYSEGQWFAIPLYKDKGYLIGIVARGEYYKKRGEFLGYFFAPNFPRLPVGQDTYDNTAENSIYICWTSDARIRKGEWPLIQNGKLFIKSDWPVPLLYRENSFKDGYAFVGEYDQDDPIFLFPKQETIHPLDEVKHYPLMSFHGTDVVRIILTRKIIKLESS